jgi:hypothetical protein
MYNIKHGDSRRRRLSSEAFPQADRTAIDPLGTTEVVQLEFLMSAQTEGRATGNYRVATLKIAVQEMKLI